MGIKIGNSPESWGVISPDDPSRTPWHRFLGEVAEAGYEWTELGPYGYLPTDPSTLRSELDARGLKVTAGALLTPLEEPSAWPELEEHVLRTGELLASMGAGIFLIVDSFYRYRTGEQLAPTRLDESAWKRLIDTTHRAAELTRERVGLQLMVHPCADTHIQYEDQIEAFLEDTDPDLVGLCLDTGHHAYRFGDPVSFMRKHHERIGYLHLKSVDGELRERVNTEDLALADAVKAGVICEPVRGVVDFAAFGDVLREVGYDGYGIVEHDMDRPALDAPFPIAKRTREFLREAGVG